MPCSLCGSELDDATAAADARIAPTAGAVAWCRRCGAALRSPASATRLMDKLRQLAQFGLTSNARLLSEPSPEDG